MSIKLNRKKRTAQQKNTSKLEPSDLYYASIAAKAAEEKKAEDILLLDVSRLSTISDYFLIVTARSTPQIEAIARHVEEKLSIVNYKLISKEGFIASNWVVLDFGNLVVHIMNETERNYYKLERFWSNAIIINNKLK